MRPEVAAGLSVFIPGRLTNPLNGSWGGWRKHARIARDWRDRTHQHVYLAVRQLPASLGTLATPKRITFTAYVGAAWDTDNLPGAIKPVRDSLIGLVIHSDAPSSGHEFVYAQSVGRGLGARRGVEIQAELRA